MSSFDKCKQIIEDFCGLNDLTDLSFDGSSGVLKILGAKKGINTDGQLLVVPGVRDLSITGNTSELKENVLAILGVSISGHVIDSESDPKACLYKCVLYAHIEISWIGEGAPFVSESHYVSPRPDPRD